MYKIVEASQKHSADLTDFQVTMAMETENLKLDEKLVREAIDYLVLHKKYGQFYITQETQNNTACGSLLATYENQKFWWIQSVYVKPEHRRKGNFTNMFNGLVQRAQKNGVKSIKLYVEKENEKAKQTYKNLGMYCNGELFYGLDLVYGNQADVERLKKPYPQGFTITESTQASIESQSLSFIFGKRCDLNRKLICIYEGQVCGYCQVFSQFSEWRFGITQYIKFLQLNKKYAREVLQSIHKFLFESSQLKVAVIRNIVTEEELVKMKEIEGGLHLEGYDVMAIDL